MKYGFRRHRSACGTVWDGIARMLPVEPVFVKVYTSQGQEVRSRLVSIGTGDSPKDILLRKPELIIRSRSLRATNVLDLGNEMFISAADIRRIAFL